MARVKLVQEEEAPPEIRQLFQKMESNGARIMNLYRVLANSPPMLGVFLKLGNHLLKHAELDPKLRELAILRIANISGSHYEWIQHVPIALGVGLEQRQLDDIARWKDSTSYSDEERALLGFTDEVALSVKVEDSTFQTMRRYLSERGIVELCMSIGYWGMIARILVPLEVETEEQTIASASDLLGQST